ncbi:mitochondrial import inner membrane translocase subunit TIM50-C-like [Palaemon carinicauda]|uniref:mitochondrial import inner membrane translocase subunit TIM50-C-like n=1 Tax=Palaemon carinicauda TaxID=392227 RepID=UPI0035B61290
MMATVRNMYLFARTAIFRVRTINLPRRTLSQLTHKQFRSGLACGGVTKLVGVYNYSTEKRPSSVGLADELLSAKVQQDTKDKPKGTDEGDPDSEKEREENEKVRRTLRWTFISFGVMITGMGGFLLWSCGSPELGPDGQPIVDEFSEMPTVQQYLLRTWKGMNDMNRMIQEPSRDKLLPDPIKPPYIQPPYTLVLELRDILVHPEWTYETGWRFKKRPGVDFLLHHCGPPLFEIVIYTNEQGFTAFPIIDHLDPNGLIWYRLYKDTTRYVNGKHVKDLSCLNRDLEKVICIDWDVDAVSSPRNHLKVKRWDGNMNDQTLVELGLMLRTIAESEVSDVREVIDYYRTFDDPLAAFRENQRLAQEQELAVKQRVEEEHQQKKFTSSIISSFFRRN